MNGKELNENLQKFLTHIDSIKDTLPMVILLLEPYQEKAFSKLQEFVDKNVAEIEGEKGEKLYSVKHEDSKVLEQLSQNSVISSLASKIIPESLFVSLISQYDAFLNQLLQIIFKIRPEYINKSERELTFSQLINFNTIEEAREYIVEKEVESVLRRSHSEHFDYLEGKLDMKLRKDLAIWPVFIEITERRNLFVHCDGKVSNQYLKVCNDTKYNTEGIKLNHRLEADIEYFSTAYQCLYELATKLTHTIWRKLIKDDIEKADTSLNAICFKLLSSGQLEQADILLEFACKQLKHHNETSKNIFIVNKALSQYLQNKKEEAKAIIESKDWSASSNDFKLAHLILTERNEEVYELMKKIGDKGEVNKESYSIWPLFYNLRNQDKFKDAFKEIFKEEYKVIEIPKRPVIELYDEYFQIKNKSIKRSSKKSSKKSKVAKSEQ